MEIALWFAKQANMYLCTDSLNLVGQLMFQFWCYWGKNDPLRNCKGVIRLAREGKWSHLSLLGRKVGNWIFLPLHSHSYSGQLSRIISRQVSAEVGEKPKQNLWKAFNTNLSGLYWKLRTVKSGWAQAFGVNTAAFGASLSSCWQFVPLIDISFTLRHSGAGGGDVGCGHHLQQSLRRPSIPLSPVLCSGSIWNEQPWV